MGINTSGAPPQTRFNAEARRREESAEKTKEANSSRLFEVLRGSPRRLTDRKLQHAMIVTVISMGVVQMAIHQVIEMIAVRD